MGDDAVLTCWRRARRAVFAVGRALAWGPQRALGAIAFVWVTSRPGWVWGKGPRRG